MLTKTVGNTLVVYEDGQYIGQITIGAMRRSKRTKWQVDPRVADIDHQDFTDYNEAMRYLLEQTRSFNARMAKAHRRSRKETRASIK